jgi:hypothetical protein
MAKLSKNRENQEDSTVESAVQDFVKGLTDEHKMLVVLKAQLYGGSWQPMLNDLNNRLEGKPYIFKLANRIKEDVERIEDLQEFEAEHRIDLADYVELP